MRMGRRTGLGMTMTMMRMMMAAAPATHCNGSSVSESHPEEDQEDEEDSGEDGRQWIIPDGHGHHDDDRDYHHDEEGMHTWKISFHNFGFLCTTSPTAVNLIVCFECCSCLPVWEYVAQCAHLNLLFFFVPHLAWFDQANPKFWALEGA